MKKNLILFAGALMVLAVGRPGMALAQQISGKTTLELWTDEQEKFSVEKIQLHEDGTVTIFGLAYRLKHLLKAGEEVTFKEDRKTASYPALLTYQLSESLEVNDQRIENYRLSQFFEAAEDSSTSLLNASANKISEESKTGKTFARLQEEYSEVYARTRPEKHIYEPSEYMLAGPLLTHTTIQYSYDLERNSFLETTKEEIIPMQFPVEDRKSLYIHDRIKVQQQAGLVSMISGQKQNDPQSYSHYKHQQLRLYNLKGSLLSQHALSFNYPLEVRLHEFIRDEHGQEAGAAYEFGTARRYGQQYSDPDPTNYELLYLDSKGEKKIRHQYRYGSAYTASEPFYATVHKDRLMVLGKGVGKEPDFHLLIFDQDSLQKITRVRQSDFYENVAGDYGLSLEQSYASRFLVTESKVLDDESIVFLGEHRSLTERTGWHSRSRQQDREHYEYRSYVFLHFSKEGDLLGNYVLNRAGQSLISQPAGIRVLSADAGKLELLLSEPCMAERGSAAHLAAEEETRHQKSGAAGVRTLTKSDLSHEYSPIVVSVNLSTYELHVLRPGDNFVSLDEHGLLHNPLRKELLLVGTTANKQQPSKLIIKKIKL